MVIVGRRVAIHRIALMGQHVSLAGWRWPAGKSSWPDEFPNSMFIYIGSFSVRFIGRSYTLMIFYYVTIFTCIYIIYTYTYWYIYIYIEREIYIYIYIYTCSYMSIMNMTFRWWNHHRSPYITMNFAGSHEITIQVPMDVPNSHWLIHRRYFFRLLP